MNLLRCGAGMAEKSFIAVSFPYDVSLVYFLGGKRFRFSRLDTSEHLDYLD